MRCQDGSLYTGQTGNLERRIKAHNGEVKGGARYTLSHGPVTLVHFEEYSTRREALKREAAIKKMQKWEKELIISHGDRPEDV